MWPVLLIFIAVCVIGGVSAGMQFLGYVLVAFLGFIAIGLFAFALIIKMMEG